MKKIFPLRKVVILTSILSAPFVAIAQNNTLPAESSEQTRINATLHQLSLEHAERLALLKDLQRVRTIPANNPNELRKNTQRWLERELKSVIEKIRFLITRYNEISQGFSRLGSDMQGIKFESKDGQKLAEKINRLKDSIPNLLEDAITEVERLLIRKKLLEWLQEQLQTQQPQPASLLSGGAQWAATFLASFTIIPAIAWLFLPGPSSR